MKILYLHQYFNTPDMPGSTRSYELSKRLTANGHMVYVLTSKRDIYQKGREGWTIEDGINVYWIPVSYSNTMGFLRRIISFLIFSLKSIKMTLSINADIIYASSTPLTIAIPAIIYSKLKGKPMVFEVRDLWPELPIAVGALRISFIKSIAFWLEKISYKNSKRIIALSNGMKKEIIKKGYPINQIDVITNLSNTNDFQKLSTKENFNIEIDNYNWDTNDKLIIYAGAFGHVNDVSYLINMADVLKKMNNKVKFIIAGEGVESNNLNAMASELGVLDQSVFIISPLEKSKIPKLYSRASVVTSLFVNIEQLWNNSANKFFDGLAAGKPIMINYSGWQRKILEENNAGFYVPYDDPFRGAEILNNIICNDNIQKSMGYSAKKIANEYFSIDVQYPKFEKILKSLI